MKVYSWGGPDNDNDILKKSLGVVRCPACNVALNKYELDFSQVEIHTGRWDVSATYDGFTIVSQRFAAVCAEHEFKGYSLQPLGKGGFVFLSERVLRVDVERSRLRFDEYCKSCERFNSAAMGIQTPVYIQQDQVVELDSFYRTDVMLAWRDEQHPMQLCGQDVANVLRKSKLRGFVAMTKHVSL